MEDRDRDDLGNLFPGTRLKLETGEEIDVRPVPFGKLKYFADAVSSLITKIEEADIDDIQNPQNWGEVFELASEEIYSIMGLVLGKDREWFNLIMPEDGLSIAELILQQNYTEGLKKKAKTLWETIQSLSPTLPSSSSPEDTSGETSAPSQ